MRNTNMLELRISYLSILTRKPERSGGGGFAKRVVGLAAAHSFLEEHVTR